MPFKVKNEIRMRIILESTNNKFHHLKARIGTSVAEREGRKESVVAVL